MVFVWGKNVISVHMTNSYLVAIEIRLLLAKTPICLLSSYVLRKTSCHMKDMEILGPLIFLSCNYPKKAEHAEFPKHVWPYNLSNGMLLLCPLFGASTPLSDKWSFIFSYELMW